MSDLPKIPCPNFDMKPSTQSGVGSATISSVTFLSPHLLLHLSLRGLLFKTKKLFLVQKLRLTTMMIFLPPTFLQPTSHSFMSCSIFLKLLNTNSVFLYLNSSFWFLLLFSCPTWFKFRGKIARLTLERQIRRK